MAGELVTAVFVDTDPAVASPRHLEDVAGRAELDGLLAGVRERVSLYDGREVTSLGKGLLVVFAAPRQALGFAVAVQRGLAGHFPSVRVGVNTGEVVGAPDDPVGEAVRAAAAIAAKAASGEVLVSDVVRQLVGSMPGVRFADRGRCRLKGSQERWRLFAVSGSESSPAAPVVFGRASELDAIEWLLEGLRLGTGRALVLEGEAGIGKTRLAAAVRWRAADAGFTVAEGGGDELEADRPGRILLGLARELELSLASVLDNPETDGANRGFAVVEAVVDAVEDAAASRPVVVIAEDLHWADELSLRGVASVARRLAPLAVGLVVTLRPEPRPAMLHSVLAVLADAPSRHLSVGSLDDAAVGALVASLTGAAPGPRLASRLHGAAGNPLYVTELVRALDEDGALRVEAGMAEMDERPTPSSMRDTVLSRLSNLAPDTVDLLRLASMMGGEFALTDLATVAGRSVVEVAARLHEPVAAGILSGEGNRLSFRHDLIREAVYDDVAPAIRLDLHAAAGRALAAAGAPAPQVARQLALGARPGDLTAVEWLERAGRETMVLDWAAALALLEQALALAPSEWTGRTHLEVALLEPLGVCGRLEDARSLARSVLDGGVSPADEFTLRCHLVSTLGMAGDMASAVAECDAAVAVPGVPPAELQAWRCIGAGLAMLTGRSAEAVHSVAAATLEQGELTADERLTCIAEQALALAAGAVGRHDEAFEHARRARRLLDGGRFRPVAWLIPHVWEAVFLTYLDRLDEAVEAYAAARGRAQRRGELSRYPLIQAGTAGAHYYTGRWDAARPELEAGLALASETGDQALTMLSHALLAHMALGRGDRPAAEASLQAGRAIFVSGRHLFGVDLLLLAQSRLLEHTGEPATALALLEMAWDQTSKLRGLVQSRDLGPALARLARAHGTPERAREVAAEMHELAQLSSAVSASAAALRCQGLADDDPDVLLEAVATYRRTPRRVDLAAACEEAAVSLFAAGRDDTAVDLLDEAASVHIDSGADADLGRVDALLRAHGVRRRRRGPARADRGWESLSPSERKVVELVAEGLSNPQIGARLFISRRTVETHLAHVFRKLGLSSRAQVAAARAARAP